MHRPQRYATRQPRPPYGSHPPRGPPPYGHPPRGPPPRGPPPPFAPSPYGPPPPRGPSSGPPPRGPSSGPPPRGPSRGPPPRGPSSGLPPRGPSSGPPPRGPSSGPPPRGPSSGPPPRGPSSGPPPRGPSSGPPSLMDLPARAPAPKAPLLATPPSGPQSGPGPRGPPPRGPHPESRSTAASANPQGDQQRSQEHQKKLRELEELQKKQIAQLEALAQEHLKQKEDTPPPLPPPLPPKESPPRPPPLPPQPPEPEPVNPQELPDDLRRRRENAERLYLQEIDRKKEDERSRIAHIDHLRRVVDEEKGNLARKQEQQRPRARPPQHDPYAPRDDPYAPHDPYAPREDPYAHKDDPYAPRADPCAPKRDPYAPPEDPYAPKRDPYAPPEDPYAPKRDPYAPPEDPYAPKRDPYAPRVDPYARKDDPYADGLDLYAPENDPYAPQNDPFAPKACDPYAPKPCDPYAPPRGPPLPPPLPREPLSRGPAPAPRGHPPVPRAPEGRRPPLHGADRMEYDDYDDYPPPKSLPHPHARRPDPYDDPYAEAAPRDPYLDDYPPPARGRGRGAYGVVAHQPPPPPRRPSPPSLSGIQEKLLEQSRKIYETEPGIDSYNTNAPPKPQPKKPEPEKPRPNEEATASKPEKANVQEEEDEVDWSSCQICDIKFTKQNAYWVHVRGLAHYQKVEEKSRQKNDEAAKETEEAEGEDEDQPDWAWCHYCSEKFKTEEAYTEHQSSQKHIVLKREHTRLTNPAPPKSDAEIKFLVEGLSQAYYCDVCDVNCNAEQSWYAHLAGKQHKKKLKRQGELDRAKKLVEAKEAAIESSVESSHTVTSKMPHQPPKRTNVKGDPYIDQVKDSAQPFKVVQQKKLMIGTLIEGTEEALIGMDYMTEFQRQGSNEEPRYTCELCESKMDQRQVINHLIGIKHRMKYFKHHYIKYYDALYYVKKSSDKTAKAKKYAETVVKIEGVQQMRVKVELDPFVNQPQYKGSAVATLPDGSKWVEVAGSNCRPEDELPGLAKKKEMKSKLDKFKYESDASESDEDLGPPRSKRRREDSDDDEDRYHRDPYMRDRYDRDPYRGGRDSRDPYARANDPYAPANDPYLRSSSPPPGPSRDPFGLGEPGRDRDMRDRDMRDRDMRDRDMRDRDMRDRDDRDPYRRDPYAGREYSVVDLPMGPAAGQNILSRHPNAPIPPPQPKPSPELMVRAMQHPTLAALDVNLLRSVVAAVGNPTPAAQANHMALNKDEILNTALRNPSLSGVDRGLLHSIVDTLSRIPGSGPPSSTAAAYPPPSSSLPLHSSTGDAAYPPPSSSLPLYSSTVTAPPVRYGAGGAAGAGKAGAQKPFPAPSAAGAGPSGKSGAHKPFPCPSSSSSTQKLVTSPFATKKSRDSLTTKSAKMAIEKVIKYLKGAEADMPKEDVEATEQATALLRSLSQCVIASEQDAKITLEICNALTKSMVDYKIQRVTNKNNANKTLKLHLDQFNKSAKLVAKFGKR